MCSLRCDITDTHAAKRSRLGREVPIADDRVPAHGNAELDLSAVRRLPGGAQRLSVIETSVKRTSFVRPPVGHHDGVLRLRPRDRNGAIDGLSMRGRRVFIFSREIRRAGAGMKEVHAPSVARTRGIAGVIHAPTLMAASRGFYSQSRSHQPSAGLPAA